MVLARPGLQVFGAGIPAFSEGRDGEQVSFDKTMELRVKDGMYQGKKVPSMADYVDSSFNEEALKLAENK